MHSILSSIFLGFFCQELADFGYWSDDVKAMSTSFSDFRLTVVILVEAGLLRLALSICC